MQNLDDIGPRLPGDSYFEFYIHYAKERQRAEAEGRHPKEVEFSLFSVEGDDLEAEGTTPLDGALLLLLFPLLSPFGLLAPHWCLYSFCPINDIRLSSFWQ